MKHCLRGFRSWCKWRRRSSATDDVRPSRVFVLAVSIWLLLPLGGVTAQDQAPGSLEKHPTLHPRLLELLRAETPPVPTDRGLVRIDSEGRVQVYIRAQPVTPALLEYVSSVGGKIDGQGFGDGVQAWVPVGALPSLADFPGVRYIEPPPYARPNVGAALTQGDSILRTDLLRQQLGTTGRGVRVGVISGGIRGLAQSIASGDLPATTFFCQSAAGGVIPRGAGCQSGERLIQTAGGVTAQSFRADRDLAADPEGTAMLEIVHDLAPGAELWFANGETALDLSNALPFLAQNVDIVVSDVAFLHFFPDGNNTVSQEVAQIVATPGNRARAYVTAVGNHADVHYTGIWTYSGMGDTFGPWHLFSAQAGVTTGPGSPSIVNQVTVPPFRTASVFLTWDDPAGHSANDYDLLLVDCATGDFIDVSSGPQTGFQEPVEVVSWTNPFASPQAVCYAIQNFANLAAPRTLNVIIDVAVGASSGHLFNTSSRSLVAPADARGDLIAVGAVQPSAPSMIEPFSSQGPTFDGRTKPDVVAPDGVSITGAGEFANPFFGTSAAAPHVAGLAALLLEVNPGLTRPQLKSILMQSAVPLGPANIFGAGRVDALGAAAQAQALLPAISVAPAGAVDFGSVLVGQSADRTFTVTSIGGTTVTGVATANPPFTVVSGGSYTLPPGAAQQVMVRFTPTGATTVTGNVTFTGGVGASRTVTGTGTAPDSPPALAVSPATDDFGTVAVGTSADRTFVVANTGGGTLTGSVTAVAPYSIVAGASFSLLGGATQTVIVRFTPTASGAFPGMASVSSNGGSTSVQLTGNSTSPGEGNRVTLNVQVIGTGTGAVTSSPIGITCGLDCAETYPAGTPVLLTPAAAQGSVFTGWIGPGCSGQGPCALTLAADIFVTALFTSTSTTVPAVVPVKGDFDGDRKDDLATWTTATGGWSITRSSTGTQQIVGFGAPGDIPVPGDYDGDGKTDVAVWRPSSGAWFIIQSSTGQQRAEGWGAPGDRPVPGDYDGDGKADLAVYRPSSGSWFITDSSTGQRRGPVWGSPGDVPVPGDYDGDGKTDLAVYRPSTGQWIIYQSRTGTVRTVAWGLPGDIPVPADYDGDGKTDVAVWRPVEGTQEGIWYILRSSTGLGEGWQYGSSTAGDVPWPLDVAGTGRDRLGVFRPSNYEFFVAPPLP